MYNLKKRAYFTDLGELRMLLADMPDDTKVCTGGVLGSYLHFSKEKELVSFDDEDLGNHGCYEEFMEDDDDEDISIKKLLEEEEEHCQRIDWLDRDKRYMLCGDKLLQTFVSDDGSWDYALYDISLSVADSGQIGEYKDMTREEAINTVLSWNHLEKEPKHYYSSVFYNLCEYIENNKMAF